MSEQQQQQEEQQPQVQHDFPKKPKKVLYPEQRVMKDVSFEISVTEGGEMMKHIVKNGEGPLVTPGTKVYYKGYSVIGIDDKETLQQEQRLNEFSFTVNSKELKKGYMPFHNTLFRSMRNGEEAIFKLDPNYAHNGELHKTFMGNSATGTTFSALNISNMYYHFVITKMEWKRPEPSTFQEKIEFSVEGREKAKQVYNSKQFKKALQLYKDIIITLSTVKDELPKEDYQRLQNEKVKVSLNIAKCHQALGEHKFCLDSIDNVITKLDRKNRYQKKGEALYIRAISNRLNGYPERALKDLEAAQLLKFDSNKLSVETEKAKQALTVQEEKIKEQQKQIMQKALSAQAPLYEERSQKQEEEEWLRQEEEDKKRGVQRWFSNDGTEFTMPFRALRETPLN